MALICIAQKKRISTAMAIENMNTMTTSCSTLDNPESLRELHVISLCRDAAYLANGRTPGAT
jgi:hypothetical protein